MYKRGTQMKDNTSRYDIQGLADELEADISDIAVLFLNYIGEMKEEVGSIQDFLSKKDWNMLQRVVHNIKGVSANLHIDDVYKAAAEFDADLKHQKTQRAEDHAKRLTGLLKGAEDEIRKFFSECGFSI